MRRRQVRERAREREKQKERRKRGNRKYGQAKRKHARKGVISCAIAAVVVTVFLLLLVFAFLSKGRSAAIIGSFGIMTEILAWIGFVTGIRGMRERDKNYLTCRLGILMNGVIGIGLFAMFVRGIV